MLFFNNRANEQKHSLSELKDRLDGTNSILDKNEQILSNVKGGARSKTTSQSKGFFSWVRGCSSIMPQSWK